MYRIDWLARIYCFHAATHGPKITEFADYDQGLFRLSNVTLWKLNWNVV